MPLPPLYFSLHLPHFFLQLWILADPAGHACCSFIADTISICLDIQNLIEIEDNASSHDSFWSRKINVACDKEVSGNFWYHVEIDGSTSMIIFVRKVLTFFLGTAWSEWSDFWGWHYDNPGMGPDTTEWAQIEQMELRYNRIGLLMTEWAEI